MTDITPRLRSRNTLYRRPATFRRIRIRWLTAGRRPNQREIIVATIRTMELPR
jgi:hypothetical protein